MQKTDSVKLCITAEEQSCSIIVVEILFDLLFCVTVSCIFTLLRDGYEAWLYNSYH